jgi:hypothetical protein
MGRGELSIAEVDRLPGQASLFSGSKPRRQSEASYGDSGERSDRLLVGVKESSFTDDESASTFLL